MSSLQYQTNSVSYTQSQLHPIKVLHDRKSVYNCNTIFVYCMTETQSSDEPHKYILSSTRQKPKLLHEKQHGLPRQTICYLHDRSQVCFHDSDIHKLIQLQHTNRSATHKLIHTTQIGPLHTNSATPHKLGLLHHINSVWYTSQTSFTQTQSFTANKLHHTNSVCYTT